MSEFGKVALVGIGLIGSSMAHAMRRAGVAGHVAGYAHTPEIVERAKAVGFTDSMHGDLAACVKDADLVVLAAPVGAFADIAKEMAPALKPGAIVSDTGLVWMTTVTSSGIASKRSSRRSRSVSNRSSVRSANAASFESCRAVKERDSVSTQGMGRD